MQAVGRDAGRLVQAVAWCAMAAALAVLIAVVAASRYARLSEIGILAALGARGSTLLKIYSIEFAAIGVLAGLIASVLTGAFASVMMSVIFNRAEITVPWRVVGPAVIESGLLTVCSGWLPAYRLLSKTLLDVLRRE